MAKDMSRFACPVCGEIVRFIPNAIEDYGEFYSYICNCSKRHYDMELDEDSWMELEEYWEEIDNATD